jgi:hypothetical protein
MLYEEITKKPVRLLGVLLPILLVMTLAVSQAGAGDIRGGVYRQNRFSPQPVPFFGARVELVSPPQQVVVV